MEYSIQIECDIGLARLAGMAKNVLITILSCNQREG